MDSHGNGIPAKACPACASAAGTGEPSRRAGIQEVKLQASGEFSWMPAPLKDNGMKLVARSSFDFATLRLGRAEKGRSC